jgi:organic hydroperoxide reductase OsmC/OhrA
MGDYRATVSWAIAPGEDFAKGQYSRGHQLTFDEGVTLAGSASPHVVGKRYAVAAAADPEELLVAAVASCHMLTFLHRARLAGFAVSAYTDGAEGEMTALEDGRRAITRVTLHPAITWNGPPPDAAALARLHAEAHHECYIANSVRAEVVVA